MINSSLQYDSLLSFKINIDSFEQSITFLNLLIDTIPLFSPLNKILSHHEIRKNAQNDPKIAKMKFRAEVYIPEY